jgi:eukaryotic-like serine/threonine-protein kinase
LRSGRFVTASVDEKGVVTKREAGPAQYYEEDLGNGVKLEMVWIRGGRFLMGSPGTESKNDAEIPGVVRASFSQLWNQDELQHPVQVSSFWMSRYEVTQAQWLAVMGSLPQPLAVSDGYKKGDDLPIYFVHWQDAKEFINKLNKLLKLEPGKGYSLPREAEWEYAARGGTTTPFPYGATITPELANYDWDNAYANGPRKPRESDDVMKIGSFVANPFGLYDMIGNVAEWCEDWEGQYTTLEQIDPTGPETGERKVIRGGDYDESPARSRSAARAGLELNSRVIPGIGIRLVRRR